MAAAKKKKKQQRARKLKRQRTRRAQRSVQRRSYARLERRLLQGPFDDYKVVVEPKGKVKMSEVLEDFVEPYRKEVDDTIEAQTKLISLAALAWNATFFPEEERREMLDDSVEKMLKGASAKAKQNFRAIVDGMIERKLAHFADYERPIVDFELTDTGRGFHLTVTSLLSAF
jgi:methionine synthase II (cobalamin-independent)